MKRTDVGMTSETLNTLLFGGCLLRSPVRSLSGDGILIPRQYQEMRQAHSFGEMFQLIEVLRGQRTVPPEIRSLCLMSPKLSAVAGADKFVGIDVALVEPASPIELKFRSHFINRFGINSTVLKPISKANREAFRIGRRWLKDGLVGMNEEIRNETANKLVNCISGDEPNARLYRDVLLETRGEKSDLAAGFRKMKELLGCPIGALLYVFRYMPDGRPISWPAGFREAIIAAASQEGLEIFDPAPFVGKFGVQRAVIEDGGHYSAAFLPVIGSALVEFAQRVVAGSRSPVAVLEPDSV